MSNKRKWWPRPSSHRYHLYDTQPSRTTIFCSFTIGFSAVLISSCLLYRLVVYSITPCAVLSCLVSCPACISCNPCPHPLHIDLVSRLSSYHFRCLSLCPLYSCDCVVPCRVVVCRVFVSSASSLASSIVLQSQQIFSHSFPFSHRVRSTRLWN